MNEVIEILEKLCKAPDHYFIHKVKTTKASVYVYEVGITPYNSGSSICGRGKSLQEALENFLSKI